MKGLQVAVLVVLLVFAFKGFEETGAEGRNVVTLKCNNNEECDQICFQCKMCLCLKDSCACKLEAKKPNFAAQLSEICHCVP